MMVLADTSIWIDHFRRSDLRLTRFLDRGDVVMHPFVIGELVLGYVPRIVWWMPERPSMVCVAGFQLNQNSLVSGNAVLPPMKPAQAFQYNSFL